MSDREQARAWLENAQLDGMDMSNPAYSVNAVVDLLTAYAAQQLAEKEQEITRLKAALDRADVALYQGDNRRAWEIVCEARREAALGGEGR
jgi:hypothetical protein